jgi:hypothetical protein
MYPQSQHYVSFAPAPLYAHPVQRQAMGDVSTDDYNPLGKILLLCIVGGISSYFIAKKLGVESGIGLGASSSAGVATGFWLAF